MRDVESTDVNTVGRFDIRKGDHAIIDSENEIAPIMVMMHPTDDGSESQYSDRASVLGLLNRLDYASKNKSNPNILDAILFLEENIIILEKIMREVDYIGRRNFKESQEFGRQKEERYLVGIQRRYDVLFNECWKLIRGKLKMSLKNDCKFI